MFFVSGPGRQTINKHKQKAAVWTDGEIFRVAEGLFHFINH